MIELKHTPQGKLASYIKFFWYSDGYYSSASKERVLPAGSSQIIINLGNNHFCHFDDVDQSEGREYPHTIITGIHSKYIFLDPNYRTSTINVVLRPGGIQALFGLPASEFLNHTVALDDVINLDPDFLRDRLIATDSPQQKFVVLESFLADVLNQSFEPNPAVLFAIRQMNNSSAQQPVSEIADNIGYSRRRFSDLFVQITGISPKKYAGIQRFQRTLRTIREYPQPNWTQIALSSGYYDQAHFNRDFKKLSGITPSQYLSNKTAEVNHLPV